MLSTWGRFLPETLERVGYFGGGPRLPKGLSGIWFGDVAAQMGFIFINELIVCLKILS